MVPKINNKLNCDKYVFLEETTDSLQPFLIKLFHNEFITYAKHNFFKNISKIAHNFILTKD